MEVGWKVASRALLGMLLMCCAGPAHAGWGDDWRALSNGRLMYQTGYMDQPYCVVDTQHKTNASAASRWVCVVTLNDNAEGSAGEHLASFYTENQGITWTGPVVVHPDLAAKKIDNSYSAVVQVNSGRIYVVCGANLDNVTSLPTGVHISRTDGIGYFLARWSDDGGATYSQDRVVLPYRQTALDRSNSFLGKVNQFWAVDQFKTRNGSAYLMFTKVSTYDYPPEEGFMLVSDNVLSEPDAHKVSWTMFPEGDHGVECPPQYAYNTTIAEEWHVIPLAKSPGFFAVFRTNVGLLGAASTKDPTGATGWGPSTYASFDMTPLPGSPAEATQALKNPRGPITLKRFSNGNYLLLWYNNFNGGFHADDTRSSRNPYWLSSAHETADGRIVFSQPEVVLYGVAAVDQRPGYPDFIEDTDGSIWISETQKTTSRVHLLPPFFLQLLWGQFDVSTSTTAGLAVDVKSPKAGATAAVPKGTFEDLRRNGSTSSGPKTGWPGFSVDVWIAGHGKSAAGQTVLATAAPGVGLGNVSVTVSAGGNLTLSMSDGHVSFSLSTDSACTAALTAAGGEDDASHYVGFVVDGGAAVGTVMVDGKLCDGSMQSDWGFELLDRNFGVPGAGTTVTLASDYGGQVLRVRMYSRVLYTTELVGNWRAGPTR